jgi:hypothetical protein
LQESGDIETQHRAAELAFAAFTGIERPLSPEQITDSF